MENKSIQDIVNESLQADLCHLCIHNGTCLHYDTLKKAVEGHRLQLASDSRIIAMVANDNLPADNPVAEKVIMKHPLPTPVVAIIQCVDRCIEK